jgi:hypothetical protein
MVAAAPLMLFVSVPYRQMPLARPNKVGGVLARTGPFSG